MSSDIKDVARRWFEEVWNNGNVAAIDEMLAADAIVNGLGPPLHGVEAFKTFHAGFRGAFPDIRIRIDDVMAEGDKVMVRWTATATHTGGGLGFAATNNRAEFSGLGVAIIRDGKIREGWNSFDQLGLFAQLGVVTLPV